MAATTALWAFAAPRLLYSFVLYALVMCLLFVTRPPSVFDPDTDQPVPFGVGPGRTMLPLGVLTALAALLSMYLFALVDLVCA